MVKIESETLNVGYPIYGAKFYNDNTLIVTGGGGDGNYGIPNQLSSLSVDFGSEEKLKQLNEFKLEGKNDSPTCLDLAGETILIGCNDNSDKVKAGENKHLRKFLYSEEKGAISFKSSVDVEKSKDTLDYQKQVSVASDGSIAAVLSSKVPGTVKVVDVKTLKTLEVLKEEKDEINDVNISPSGKRIAYITEKKLVVFQSDDDKPTLKHERFAPTYNLTKVKFISEDEIIIGINLKFNGGILLSHVVIEEGKFRVKKSRILTDKTKKITALDTSSDLVSVAGNDNSLLIAGIEHFDVYKTLKNLHNFAITRVAFSPNGKYLASTSASNTVNVIKIPEDISKSYYWVYVQIIVAIIAYLVYYLISRITPEQKEQFDDLMRFLFEAPENPYAQVQDEERGPAGTHSSTQIIEELVTYISECDIVGVSTISCAKTETDVYEDASTLI